MLSRIAIADSIISSQTLILSKMGANFAKLFMKLFLE